MKKLTTQEWIEKAKIIHGNKYDYSKVQYKNATTKVCIICPEHGEFYKTPHDHISGKQGCPKCSNLKKLLGIDNFIQKAAKVHNNKYNYNKSIYIKAKEPIEIVCPKHGSFWQTPNDHLNGKGCPECKKDKLHNLYALTKKEFIEKAIQVHNNKYNYDKVNYVNNKTKVIITCLDHGDFEQIPSDHLQGHGCPKCIEHHSNGGLLSSGEKIIENFLKSNNIKYQIQYPIKIQKEINISGMAYIDFYLSDYNLFIEYNGIQHYIPQKYFGGQISFEHQQKRDVYVKNYCKTNNINLLEIKYDDNIQDKLQNALNVDCLQSISCL